MTGDFRIERAKAFTAEDAEDGEDWFDRCPDQRCILARPIKTQGGVDDNCEESVRAIAKAVVWVGGALFFFSNPFSSDSTRAVAFWISIPVMLVGFGCLMWMEEEE